MLNEYRKCGRPTKAKTPCKQLVSDRFALACTKHEDDEDIAKRKLLHEAYEQGIELGEERGKNLYGSKARTLRLKVESLEKYVATLHDREKLREDASPRRKRHEDEEPQVVEVDNRYAYKWDGSHELQVGDMVWLPDAGFNGPRSGTVTSLRSDYSGRMSYVMFRIVGK